MVKSTNSLPTVVLVHGAWSDASSWNKVTCELQARGVRVVSAQIPLTSLSDDIAAVRRYLVRESGPVVLVGHSYGGAVITGAGADNPKVKALVYIAAIVPDIGETVGDIFQRAAPHPKAPRLQPDSDGLLWVDADAFRNAIAPDAAPEETVLLAVNQKPIAAACLGEALAAAAWRNVPSWFLIPEDDRMVSPDTQRFTAERMNASVTIAPVDHWPLASAAGELSDFIANAAAAA
ncbi:MAG TPA: alpha/beta hydrolase [Burkholderiales bacterium]|nr:alpha/beta hydrolase [Burkholderiales bacterium]